MRIVYVGAFRLPDLDAAAPRVLTIGKMLRDAGHEVCFMAWGGRLSDEYRDDDGIYRVDGFRFTISNELNVLSSAWGKLRQWYTRGSESLRMLSRSISEFDAIIAYQPGYFFLRRLKRLCRRYNKKLIVDITEWYDDKELHLLDRPLNYLNMTREIKNVDNKILISSHLDKYYSGSHNIVIPATTDISEKKCSKDAAKEFGRFDGITFIYAGTPSFKDKLFVAVNAINRLIGEDYPLRFFVFGVTKKDYMANYPGKLSENINFMGRVGQADIPGFYRQSDFMILLRDRTRKNMMGFPTKFAEAVTAGIPVISNDTSDITAYLNDGINGFVVDAPDEDSLYDLIRKIVRQDDPIFLKKLKTNASARKTLLDYRNFTDRMSTFINTLT